MSDLVDFPENPEKAAPTEKKTDTATGVPNWASNEETVEKVRKRAQAYFSRYDSQAARDKMEDDLKNSDAMFRMALNQSKQNENNTRNEVDTVPDAFFRALRAINANETQALFSGGELGVAYTPNSTLKGDQRDHAMQVSEDQKTLLEYSFEIDDRVSKLTDSWWYMNKNANALFGMEWTQREVKTREREPTDRDEEGKPTKYVWKTTTRTEAHPTLTMYPIDRVWLDATIDDIQQQQCILIRHYPVLSELVGLQKAGKYINVAKIGSKQLYSTEEPGQTQQDYEDNAETGQSRDEETGQFDGWHVPMYAPINDQGEWDDDMYPRRILATFIGPIESTDSVCVSLTKNGYDPEDNGEIPYFWGSSHYDDKGAYSMGYVHLLKPAYDEYKTTLDQWFDNKNLVNNAPWITERGAMHTQDKTFGPRRLLEMQMGMIEKLKRVAVPSNTGDMQNFIAYLEARIKETAGTTAPFLGEAMGSRTSASEATNALEQAMKPAMEKLRRMARVLEWIGVWDMRMWRMFSPADQMFSLVQKGKVKEIKPANLWGPLRVKITAIDDFEKNSVGRAEQNQFMRDTLPMAKDVLSKKEFRNTLKWIYRQRDFPVDELWVGNDDMDARHIARSEDNGFFNLIEDLPKEGENHEVHLDEHGQDLRLYKMNSDADPEVVRLFDVHMEVHNQMLQQQESQAPQTPQGEVSPPRTSGEVSGDAIAGQSGTLI